MFSRFFIDRPIFATVISIVITLAGAVAVFTLPVAQYPEVTPPTVQVTAIYPGANSQTVRDTVAAPIEAQVSGVEGMMYMSSQTTNDGSYTLTVTFRLGMDSDMAQVLVQNRVSLALPVIPALVQNEGISVKKMSPNTLMIVNLVNSDPKKPLYDSIFLSNYATIYVKDELGRLSGVAGITYLGQRDYSLRVWLDPGKMAALNLSAMDVVTAITQQNVQVAAGQVGQPPTTRDQMYQLTINTQGRLTDPEQFENIILKAGKNVVGQTPPTAMPAQAMQASNPSGISGAGAQATPIVRMRDVVRPNKFFARIKLDPAKLAQRKLDPEDIARALRKDHIDVEPDPEVGPANGPQYTWQAILGGKQDPHVNDIADTKLIIGPEANWPRLGDLVVKDRGIERLFTKDEKGVQLGAQQYDQSCTLNGQPSVALSIYQLPGSNALNTADGVYAKMRELKARFPDGLDYKIVYDTTPFIRESVAEVFNTLRDAVILVAIVVLLFLQDWRAMILPMIDVPVSLIGTFAIMAAMGFTLNNLTLFGLVLAIGIVVDDAIVVLENIERQMATGLNARDATIKAMDEITGPILAITLVLTAVFIPCCFLGGITGQFFRQFAVTIAVSTIISAINAITMTPSRAVMIFKTEEVLAQSRHDQPASGHGVGSHQLIREALPWWIFGLLGLVGLWLGPIYLRDLLHLPDTTRNEDGISLPTWQIYGINAIYCAPGLFVGLLIGWFIINPVNAGLGWFFRAFNRAFDRITEVYGAVVGKVLRISVIVCIAYGGLLVLTGVQFSRAPTGFIPQQDKGYLILTLQLPDAASVERTEKVMAQIEQLARKDKNNPNAYPGIPGIKNIVGVSGKSLILNANAPNLGSMYVMLDDFDHRHSADRSADAIGAELESLCREGGYILTDQALDSLKTAGMPDAIATKLLPLHYKLFSVQKFKDKLESRLSADELKQYQTQVLTYAERRMPLAEGVVATFGGPPVDGLGTTGGYKIIIEDRGNIGEDELQKVCDAIVQEGNNDKEGKLTGLGHSARAKTPWLYLDIDRDKCMSLGVSVADVFNTLQINLGSFYVNNFNNFGRTWQVNVQADQKFRNRIEDIPQLQVRNSQGQMVRFGTFLQVRENNFGPVMVMRYNMYAATAITGNSTPGTSSGQAIERLQQIADEKLPRSMASDWTELTYLQLQAGNAAMFVFGLAVMFVFLVLAAQYESWSLPLAVILVVPMCLLCSVSGVVFANMEVNIFTQIGFVVLVGLASKNAILIVEFAKQRREEGMAAWEATVQASQLRLRPILMTSFAFILGVVPLVVATGAGHEMRQSLGLAVFAGMCGVTLFGIVLTPVFYYSIQWWFAGSGPTHPPASHDLVVISGKPPAAGDSGIRV